MINEIDEALRNLMRAEVVNGADIEVLFEAPTREWAARRNTPTVDLYLYDIREDLRHRQTGTIDRRNEDGIVVERRQPPRFFKLAYLITAWTQRPEDEHRLLSAILSCFLRHETLPQSVLPPGLDDLESPLQVLLAYPPPENRQVSDVWASLGGDLKPSLDLVITIAIFDDTLFKIAQAVMEPMRLKAVGVNTSEAEDQMRQHPDRRGDQAAPSGSGAEAADRGGSATAPASKAAKSAKSAGRKGP